MIRERFFMPHEIAYGTGSPLSSEMIKCFIIGTFSKSACQSCRLLRRPARRRSPGSPPARSVARPPPCHPPPLLGAHSVFIKHF